MTYYETHKKELEETILDLEINIQDAQTALNKIYQVYGKMYKHLLALVGENRDLDEKIRIKIGGKNE